MLDVLIFSDLTNKGAHSEVCNSQNVLGMLYLWLAQEPAVNGLKEEAGCGRGWVHNKGQGKEREYTYFPCCPTLLSPS